MGKLSRRRCHQPHVVLDSSGELKTELASSGRNSFLDGVSTCSAGIDAISAAFVSERAPSAFHTINAVQMMHEIQCLASLGRRSPRFRLRQVHALSAKSKYASSFTAPRTARQEVHVSKPFGELATLRNAYFQTSLIVSNRF